VLISTPINCGSSSKYDHLTGKRGYRLDMKRGGLTYLDQLRLRLQLGDVL
jgi:hypothetical protein